MEIPAQFCVEINNVTFSTRAGMRRLLAVRLMILMMMIVLRHGSAFLDALMRRAPAGG